MLECVWNIMKFRSFLCCAFGIFCFFYYSTSFDFFTMDEGGTFYNLFMVGISSVKLLGNHVFFWASQLETTKTVVETSVGNKQLCALAQRGDWLNHSFPWWRSELRRRCSRTSNNFSFDIRGQKGRIDWKMEQVFSLWGAYFRGNSSIH